LPAACVRRRNGDGAVNLADAVFVINYVFKGGAAPDPYNAGDANCDAGVDLADAVFLINYVFKGGPEPGADKRPSVTPRQLWIVGRSNLPTIFFAHQNRS